MISRFLGAVTLIALLAAAYEMGSPGDPQNTQQYSQRSDGTRIEGPRGEGARNQGGIRVCSQNLFRFGSEKFSKNKEKREKQKTFLVSRMKRAACDVIAVQEVSGKNRWRAGQLLQELADSLGQRSGRRFKAFVGDSQDAYIRNGFILAEDLGSVVSFDSYWRETLPKIQKRGRPRSFVRGPVSLELELAQPRSGISRLLLFSVHLKSKSNSWKDPTRTEFEVYRMESAQAVREIALKALEKSPEGTMLFVMGDRNSTEGSASADTLEGAYELSDFHENCRLTEKIEVTCVSEPKRRGKLLGLFE